MINEHPIYGHKDFELVFNAVLEEKTFMKCSHKKTGQ
jgi:hypothetical protein